MKYPIVKTNCICPKCHKKLWTSDLADYSFVCINCDENFFEIEAICPEEYVEIQFKVKHPLNIREIQKLEQVMEELHVDFFETDNTSSIKLGWLQDNNYSLHNTVMRVNKILNSRR